MHKFKMKDLLFTRKLNKSIAPIVAQYGLSPSAIGMLHLIMDKFNPNYEKSEVWTGKRQLMECSGITGDRSFDKSFEQIMDLPFLDVQPGEYDNAYNIVVDANWFETEAVKYEG